MRLRRSPLARSLTSAAWSSFRFLLAQRQQPGPLPDRRAPGASGDPTADPEPDRRNSEHHRERSRI